MTRTPKTARTLWTGPPSALGWDRVFERADFEARCRGLFIAASEPAREALLSAIARRRSPAIEPRVWTWHELWLAVRRAQATDPKTPRLLSEAGVRAALRLAIDRARRDGFLERIGPVAFSNGFLRQTRENIARLKRVEIDPPSRPASPFDAVFREYQRILNRDLRATDRQGLARWASSTMRKVAPEFGPITILDLVELDAASSRALRFWTAGETDLLATVPYDPFRPELFEPILPTYSYLIDLGFQVETLEIPENRPGGLRALDRGLFIDDSAKIREADDSSGLTIEGITRGEGEGCRLAERVLGRLLEGECPERLAVLFREWDDRADETVERLRQWGIPISAWGEHRPLSAHPTVATLLAAIRLPLDGWDADALIRLLRGGRVRLTVDPLDSARAASALRDTRVFRGLSAMREGLERLVSAFKGIDDERRAAVLKRRADRAKIALPIIERLRKLYDGVLEPTTWAARVDRLRELARGLGLENAEDDALECLYDALDDQNEVWSRAEGPGRAWTWRDFENELHGLSRWLEVPSRRVGRGGVIASTVEGAVGARARHVFVANLEEGTFPSRRAIALDPSDESVEVSTAFRRESVRFLELIGRAERSLTLSYPTLDEKGHELIRASFLDDAEAVFSLAARANFPKPVRTLGLARNLSADAGPPALRRLIAISRALRERSFDDLKRLAGRPEHRPALEGAALALYVSHQRNQGRTYDLFNGRLTDPRALDRLSAELSPQSHVFSPSQLESLSLCPFQFWLKYVLKLEPVADRDELDDDHAKRGSLIHRALELMHVTLRDDPVANESIEARVDRLIDGFIEREMEREPEAVADVERTIAAIERERLRRLGRAYARQFRAYLEKQGRAVDCYSFETTFGEDVSTALELGGDGALVRIRGTIDRIDKYVAADGIGNRIIDYKTKGVPPANEMEKGLALQLPLYAMAVERMADPAAVEPIETIDFGYWGLSKNGYESRLGKSARTPEAWREFKERIESFVVALAASARRGEFFVHPRVDGCVQKCDYRRVCRITSSTLKEWPDQPRLADVEPSKDDETTESSLGSTETGPA